jgi:hypothetical protein
MIQYWNNAGEELLKVSTPGRQSVGQFSQQLAAVWKGFETRFGVRLTWCRCRGTGSVQSTRMGQTYTSAVDFFRDFRDEGQEEDVDCCITGCGLCEGKGPQSCSTGFVFHTTSRYSADAEAGTEGHLVPDFSLFSSEQEIAWSVLVSLASVTRLGEVLESKVVACWARALTLEWQRELDTVIGG